MILMKWDKSTRRCNPKRRHANRWFLFSLKIYCQFLSSSFFFYTFTLKIDWDLAPAEEEVTAHAPSHQYRHASITTAVGNQCGKDPFFYFLCLQMHSDTHFKPTQNNFLLGVASYLIEIPPPHPLLADTIKFISKTFLYGDFIIYYLLIFNKLYFNF